MTVVRSFVLIALSSLAIAGCDCDGTRSAAFPDAGDAGDGGNGFDAGPPPECPTGDDSADTTELLAPGQVRAGRISDDVALIPGPSADGKLGDFKIYNSRVAFVVEAEGIGDNYIPYGGSLVDADLVRTDDQTGGDAIDEMVATPGLVAFAADCVGVVRDGSDGEAVIRAVGTDEEIPILNGTGLAASNPRGLWVVNDYRLGPDDVSLEVTTTIENPTRGTVTVDVGDFLLLSDDGYDPFDTVRGFSRATTRAPIIGSAAEASHFALGVFAAEGDLDGDYAGIGSLLAGEGPGGDVSLFVYSQGRLSIAPGDTRSWTRYVALGRDVDDLVRERHRRIGTPPDDLVTLSGIVREEGTGTPVEGARVHVFTDDSYASGSMTDAEGRYEALVPPGTYSVVATGASIGQDVMVPNRPPPEPPFATGRHKGPVESVDATGGDAVQDLTISGTVPVDITITDGGGRATAGKVTFEFPDGVDPSPPDPWIGERDPYRFASNVFWTSDGRIRGNVAPGTYHVVASSGFEHELDAREDVDLVAGVPWVETFVLDEVVDRAGYASIDTHLHAAPSIEGEITQAERIVTNLAEGLDAMAITDHDRVGDYADALAGTGLEGSIVVLPGEEISTFLTGHFNVFPVTLRPELSDDGRIPWWDLDVEEIFEEALGPMEGIVLQVNHGTGGFGGYFDAARYDPVTGEIGRPGNWSDLFNAMEIVNGKSDGNWEDRLEVFYGLVNHGKRVGMTGVSDSHQRIPEAGYGRTYVWLGEAEATPETIAMGIRDGRTVVSGGPLVTLRAGGGDVREGDALVLPAAGDVELDIRVQAPSWISVDTVTVIREGVEIDVIESSGEAPVWVEETRAYPVDADTWFVVRADGEGDLRPAYPGARPFAITSPIYVDVR